MERGCNSRNKNCLSCMLYSVGLNRLGERGIGTVQLLFPPQRGSKAAESRRNPNSNQAFWRRQGFRVDMDFSIRLELCSFLSLFMNAGRKKSEPDWWNWQLLVSPNQKARPQNSKQAKHAQVLTLKGVVWVKNKIMLVKKYVSY